MFFIMFKNRDEFELATTQSFSELTEANAYVQGVHPACQAFVVSSDKFEIKDPMAKFFVFFEHEDILQNVRRKYFDSWESAENDSQCVNKNLKSFVVGQV